MTQMPDHPDRRKLLRWTGHDYRTPAIYFVTICTVNRLPLFGHVDETGRLPISPIGEVVYGTWHDLPDRFPAIETMAFIAMPDHVHRVLEVKPDAASEKEPIALGRIISVFKSVTNHRTKPISRTSDGSGSIWLQGFHDRVIRSDEELRRIEWYIAENPARWAAARMTSSRNGDEAGLA